MLAFIAKHDVVKGIKCVAHFNKDLLHGSAISK
jgi:hypothetical protein